MNDKTSSSSSDGSGSDGFADKSYSVNITARPGLRHKTSSGMNTQRKNRAALEANRAAFGYAKVAALFFVSLLVTWVPSSINRVYSLIHPDSVSVSYSFAAGIVLSLMGFWNSVIYITTSWRACKILFDGMFRRVKVDEMPVVSVRRSCGRGRGSGGDSVEGLAVERDRERESV